MSSARSVTSTTRSDDELERTASALDYFISVVGPQLATSLGFPETTRRLAAVQSFSSDDIDRWVGELDELCRLVKSEQRGVAVGAGTMLRVYLLFCCDAGTKLSMGHEVGDALSSAANVAMSGGIISPVLTFVRDKTSPELVLELAALVTEPTPGLINRG